MDRNDRILKPEDYEEPACLLCGKPYGSETPVQPIPQQRIAEKLNDYMSRRDYTGAERHLLYWLQEAELGNDLRGRLFLDNELVGHYRKVGDRDKAFARAEEALALLDRLELGGSVSAGTTFINTGTAYHAFGEHEKALTLFEKARAIYESGEQTPKHLLGGLYNNMALVCTALGRYDEALRLFEKAMDAMGEVAGGKLEQAISCLNMADALAARDGPEESETQIAAMIDRAERLLHDPSIPHDGYYAFVCEKCAPSFSYYGYFAVAEELKQEAERIYARP